MSEEILKALMQLFAIIAKQDEGVEANEIEYVTNFLTQQLSEETVEEYMALFEEFAGLSENENKNGNDKKKKDSGRVIRQV